MTELTFSVDNEQMTGRRSAVWRDPRCETVDVIPLGLHMEYAYEGSDFDIEQLIGPVHTFVDNRTLKIKMAMYSKATGRVSEIVFTAVRDQNADYGSGYGQYGARVPTIRERAIIDAIVGADA